MPTARPKRLAPRHFHRSFLLGHHTRVGSANLALWLFLLHDARVGGTDRALGLPHLLQVPDGLAERLDDAGPWVRAWLALHLLLHCTWVGRTHLVIADDDDDDHDVDEDIDHDNDDDDDVTADDIDDIADDIDDKGDVDEERWLPLMLQSPLGVDNSQPLLIMQHQPNPRPHLSLCFHSIFGE